MHNLYRDQNNNLFFCKKKISHRQRVWLCEYRHDGGWRTAHVPRAVHINWPPPPSKAGLASTGARKFRAQEHAVTQGAWRSTRRQRRPRNQPGRRRRHQLPYPHHCLAGPCQRTSYQKSGRGRERSPSPSWTSSSQARLLRYVLVLVRVYELWRCSCGLRPPLVFYPSAGPKNPSYAQRVQSIPASTCMFLKSRCLLPDYSVLFNRHPDQQQLASSAYKRGLYCRSIRVYRQVLTLCSIGRQSGSSGFRFLFTYVRFFCALPMYTKSLFQLASYDSPSNQIRRYELGNQKRMMILDLYHYTL
jgi:hypothetical protein